jgi:hypothetical protein
MPELQRARELLLRVLQKQVEEWRSHLQTRAGSRLTWWDYRLDHFNQYASEPYNPNHQDKNTRGLIDSCDEIFPETENGENTQRQPVTDVVRKSRLRLLESFKHLLYRAFKNNDAPTLAIRRLWHSLMQAMHVNAWLQFALDADGVHQKWSSLSDREQEIFLQTFDFDENAPEQAVTQQPTLTAECIIFARTLEQLDKPANFFISRECHKKYCRNPYEWFDIVRDIPGEDYTICTEQYQPPDPLWKNGNGITDRDAHIAIELRCKHIICLPCFLNWIWSGMQNYNMWPLCRADLRPPNPAPE